MNGTAFQHVVCHLYGEDDLKGEISLLHIPVFCLGMKRLSQWPKGMVRLLRIIKKYRPDLIHTQLFGADVMGRVLGCLLGIPVVSTLQSSVYEPGIPYFRSRGRQWIDGWTGRLCRAKFIAVSQFVKQSVQKRLNYREEDIVVIHNSVDPGEFSPNGDRSRLRRSLGWDDRDIFLICVGKLNPPKGQNYLIQALPKVIREYQRVKLLVVGSGPNEREWEALSQQLGLKDAVFFMGDRKDIKDLLEASDIFVVPSLSEGLPVALLEAMSMKKPCIASDIPPVREVIGERKAGILVEPGSAEAIAAALLEVLRSPERAGEMASHARELVVEKFHAGKNARLLEEFYSSLFKETSRKMAHEN